MKSSAFFVSYGTYRRVGLLLLVVAAVWLVFLLSPHFSLSSVQAVAADILAYVEVNPLRGFLLFALFYGVLCALPTPFISVFTILAGYLFGNVVGLLLVSLMSAIGGTVLFIVVRYTLSDWVRARLPSMPLLLQQAASADNFGAALSLRLIPGFPFPIPAVVLALSRLRLWKFYLSTQLGLLIPLAVYVNAGSSFSEITSLEGILSPQLIVSLLLLALVPWLLGVVRQRLFK